MTTKNATRILLSEGKFQKVADWITDESKTIIFTKYIVSAEECRKRFPESNGSQLPNRKPFSKFAR